MQAEMESVLGDSFPFDKEELIDTEQIHFSTTNYRGLEGNRKTVYMKYNIHLNLFHCT